MSEEIIGGSDLGTASSTEQTSQTESTESQVSTEPQVEDVNGIKSALMAEREKAKRLQEYNEFLRNRPAQPVNQPDPFEDIRKLGKEEIPYVADVEKLVELKLYEKELQFQEQRMLDEVRNLSQIKASQDPTFQEKMRLAFEVLDRDPVLSDMVEAQPTAQAKLDKLAWIATSHPLYEDISRRTSQSEIIEAVKKNASMPTTLAGIPSLGTSSKPVSQMNREEFKTYFDSVKKQL